ncbi:hypothetical protein OU5_P0051 (plasmid) [Pseudomonas mandelii JR-1]|uniref:Uncharacterized protein n=1 Tax=Pseudomonas mandelii JR-1 TaxID=1147786 RepID=A0A024ELN9_9PSED|nr:hypothetical protein OU5_P0051 [Pseudomonas mandelii JR-1]
MVSWASSGGQVKYAVAAPDAINPASQIQTFTAARSADD